MNCPKCGKDIGDSKSCPDCNTFVEENAEQIDSKSNLEIRTSEKSNKILQLLKSKWILIGILAIAVLVVLIVCLSGSSVKTVPLSYENEEYNAAFEMTKEEFVKKYNKLLSKNFSENEKQFYTIDLSLLSEENFFATYFWENSAETITIDIETDKNTGYIVEIAIWFSSTLDETIKEKITNNAFGVIDNDWTDNISIIDEENYVADKFTIKLEGKWAVMKAAVENK